MDRLFQGIIDSRELGAGQFIHMSKARFIVPWLTAGDRGSGVFWRRPTEPRRPLVRGGPERMRSAGWEP